MMIKILEIICIQGKEVPLLQSRLTDAEIVKATEANASIAFVEKRLKYSCFILICYIPRHLQALTIH